MLGLILSTVVLFCGCVTRIPLKGLPGVDHETLHLESKATGEYGFSAESGVGHNVRQNAGMSGLLGVGVSEWVAGSTRPKKSVIQQLRGNGKCQEEAILEFALKFQLNNAGLNWSEQHGERTLSFRLDSVDLNEMQRRFWRVSASVTAAVGDAAKKNVWTVHVRGSSATLRSLDEFCKAPQLYVDDFREAAEDAARQLVVGPIRK